MGLFDHQMNRKWLVFTDLDGTLLDHHTYDYSAALPALQRLKALSFPIIPVSSKTLAELRVLVAELDLQAPLIAENGSVISLPGEPQPRIIEPSYADIRHWLSELRVESGYQFTGFGDMTVQEVVAATGLSEPSARLAMQQYLPGAGLQKAVNGRQRKTACVCCRVDASCICWETPTRDAPWRLW